MKKKVIAAGHICLDITPTFPERKAGQSPQKLIPGSLLQVGAADIHTGGSVANTGLAMKLLGANVSLMGKVGEDAFGRLLLDLLKKDGAEGGMLLSPGENTSYSVVLSLPGTDRIFLHDPGANDTFSWEDVPEADLRGAALFHFGYPPLMKRIYENEGEGLVRLLEKARAAGAATSLDLAAVDSTSPAGGAPWDRILTRALPLIDFFVPSAEELCFMLDRPRYEEWQRRAAGRDVTEVLDLSRDIEPLADRCMALGAKILLIKCGAPGLYYRTAGADALHTISPRLGLDVADWANRQGFEPSYLPEQVISGTGAGDTTIAAFLTTVLEGIPPEECLQLATATGACCVSAYDALSGLLPLELLRKKIKKGWKKQCLST